MTIETDIVMTVGALCGGRIFPDVASFDTAKPFVTYIQVGGETIDTINDYPAAPNLRNSRIQFNVWATTRNEANTLMRTIEDALRAAPLNGRPAGALIARHEEVTDTKGAQLDFKFWWG